MEIIRKGRSHLVTRQSTADNLTLRCRDTDKTSITQLGYPGFERLHKRGQEEFVKARRTGHPCGTVSSDNDGVEINMKPL